MESKEEKSELRFQDPAAGQEDARVAPATHAKKHAPRNGDQKGKSFLDSRKNLSIFSSLYFEGR
jgi:hypothetical protein